MIPATIIANYPDVDLVPIDRPKPGESMADYIRRIDDETDEGFNAVAADGLYAFICRELSEDTLTATEAIVRIDRAIEDLVAIRQGLQRMAGKYLIVRCLEDGRLDMWEGHAIFWCANGIGYTSNLDEAGRYTLDDALKRTSRDRIVREFDAYKAANCHPFVWTGKVPEAAMGGASE